MRTTLNKIRASEGGEIQAKAGALMRRLLQKEGML